MFKLYVIKDTDSFDPCVYPHVVEEIGGLHSLFREFNGGIKTAIVLSFLKDHCIKTEWVAAHKQLVAMLTSGSLPISHLESLFISARHNAAFLSGLDSYITIELNKPTDYDRDAKTVGHQ